MKPLVLTSKACFLAVRRHHLLVTDYIARTQNEYTARHLPFDLILLYRAGGNVSFEAVRFLMLQGVPIIHVGWNGEQVGVTLPPRPVSGELRLAQYKAALDPVRREKLARAFVAEKVSKSVELLRFMNARYPSVDLASLESVAPMASPMGFEGKVAEAYWIEFAKIIKAAQSDFEFPARKQGSNNLGATDPVNSLLNYGYGILEARVRLAVQRAGLDPDIGFLHQSQPGAVPLVYDLMEPFRWLVDLTAIELLESRIIRPEDFDTKPDYRMTLGEVAARRVVERLAQNFNRMTRVRGKNARFDATLDVDARNLARALLTPSDLPNFGCDFRADASKADSNLAERLLRMSVEERKVLGIPKTTLFCLKQNLVAGKPIRVYEKVRQKLG